MMDDLRKAQNQPPGTAASAGYDRRRKTTPNQEKKEKGKLSSG
jgi:hypothetical protein